VSNQASLTKLLMYFSTANRQKPLIEVWNSASLPIILKNERFKASFVSVFSPGVIADDVEKSLKMQSSLNNIYRFVAMVY
jgi:hypothetical protein